MAYQSQDRRGRSLVIYRPRRNRRGFGQRIRDHDFSVIIIAISQGSPVCVTANAMAMAFRIPSAAVPPSASALSCWILADRWRDRAIGIALPRRSPKLACCRLYVTTGGGLRSLATGVQRILRRPGLPVVNGLRKAVISHIPSKQDRPSQQRHVALSDSVGASSGDQKRSDRCKGSSSRRSAGRLIVPTRSSPSGIARDGAAATASSPTSRS